MLDKIDSSIIRILMDNPRESISNIARKTGLSRPTVRNRIKKLREKGVIKGFSIVLNEEMINDVKVLCIFRAVEPRKVFEKLKNIEEVSDIYYTTNEQNIICIVRFADISVFKNILNEFLSFNIPFNISIVLDSVRKNLTFRQLVEYGFAKIACDYCGKEVKGKPLTHIHYNRKYYFCCPTCLREFRKKFSKMEKRK